MRRGRSTERFARQALQPTPDRPRWFTCSEHAIRTGTGRERELVPYGARHAREVGSVVTACGRLTVTWLTFWDLTFEASAAPACQQCVTAIRGARR